MTEYEDKNFSKQQVYQLQLAKKQSIEAESFADPKYSWRQMREIRIGIRKGVDYTVYASEDVAAVRMREMRMSLQKGKFNKNQMTSSLIDVVNQAKKLGYGHSEVNMFVKLYSQGFDCMPYLAEKYPKNLLVQIIKGIRLKNPLLSKFLTPDSNFRILRELNLEIAMFGHLREHTYNDHQSFQIRSALKKGVDITPYINEKYNYRKMDQIKKGLLAGVDVSLYSDIGNNSYQMREIRLALEDGLYIMDFLKKDERWQDIKAIREFFKKKKKLIAKCCKEQIREIVRCIRAGVNISSVTSKTSAVNIRKLRTCKA
mgnify:FL=1